MSYNSLGLFIEVCNQLLLGLLHYSTCHASTELLMAADGFFTKPTDISWQGLWGVLSLYTTQIQLPNSSITIFCPASSSSRFYMASMTSSINTMPQDAISFHCGSCFEHCFLLKLEVIKWPSKKINHRLFSNTVVCAFSESAFGEISASIQYPKTQLVFTVVAALSIVFCWS